MSCNNCFTKYLLLAFGRFYEPINKQCSDLIENSPLICKLFTVFVKNNMFWRFSPNSSESTHDGIVLMYSTMKSLKTEIEVHCRCFAVNFRGVAWTPQKQWRGSAKKDVLTNFASFTRKHLCWSLFLIKFNKTTLLKRESNTDVFLWNLRNFLEHIYQLFLRLSFSTKLCPERGL